jgi:membrane-associated protease RseP (regulator of RpoE activity)
MHTRSLRFLLIAVLCGIGFSTARAEQSPAAPTPPHDDVQVTVTGKGRLGIVALQISPELRAHLGAPRDRGVLVDAVRPDSPAARAGLRVGDIVTDVDGDATRSAPEVLDALADHKKGDEVAIVAFRSGQRVELRARLDSDPGPIWQSRSLRGLQGPNDLDSWFRFDGAPDDMRNAIDELRKRMEQLEHRLQNQPSSKLPGGTERI